MGRLSIAPMMALTDRHYRYWMRGITHHTLLYTEMVTTGALLHGDQDRHLAYSPEEHPIALQLGGDDPKALAACTRLAAQWGYDEVNLNVGCPSDRVQNGNFGACLMAQPERVRDCIAAMKEAADLPVTVKHRIGIDDQDRYEDMVAFVQVVAEAGADRFSVHARKAWLKGLSPKENRTVPPLRYDDVYRLKQALPHLSIEINGGVQTWPQIRDHLTKVDAVMIGRTAYDHPLLFASADYKLYGAPAPNLTRRALIERMIPYIQVQYAQGVYLSRITRHILTLFHGKPGTKAFKRFISENAYHKGADAHVVLAAMHKVPAEVLDEVLGIDEVLDMQADALPEPETPVDHTVYA